MYIENSQDRMEKKFVPKNAQFSEIDLSLYLTILQFLASEIWSILYSSFGPVPINDMQSASSQKWPYIHEKCAMCSYSPFQNINEFRTYKSVSEHCTSSGTKKKIRNFSNYFNYSTITHWFFIHNSFDHFSFVSAHYASFMQI